MCDLSMRDLSATLKILETTTWDVKVLKKSWKTKKKVENPKKKSWKCEKKVENPKKSWKSEKKSWKLEQRLKIRKVVEN